MTNSERQILWTMLMLLLGIWVLELVAFLMAQFSVDVNFAETWGCRPWTIQTAMVAICGFLIIWSVILATSLFVRQPRASMMMSFSSIGTLLHLIPGIANIIDYGNGEASSVSQYCDYTAMTLAVAILMVILGVLSFLLTILNFYRKYEPCPECT